jgi:hypothetical protein
MTNKKISINLSSVDESIKNDFTQITKKLDLTQLQLFERMLQNFKFFNLSFTEEEQQKIEQAKIKSGDYYNRKIKNSILRTANNLLNSEDKDVSTDVSNSYHSANKRADEVLDKMIETNNNASSWTDKTFINQVSISRFSSDLKDKDIVKFKLSNDVIRRCLVNNQDKIEKHHKNLGLEKKHNLKKYHFLNKQSK